MKFREIQERNTQKDRFDKGSLNGIIFYAGEIKRLTARCPR